VPDAAENLRRYLRVQGVTDAKLRRILHLGARDARARLAAIGGREGIGAEVRRAQIRIAEQQIQSWLLMGEIIHSDRTNTVNLAARIQAEVDQLLFLAADAGISATAWARSMTQTAQEGIRNLYGRLANNIPLSRRVYDNAALDAGRIDRLINSALLRGDSAREIANAVYRHISPTTPGGTSYAAMRLGRTELNNAFHTTSRNLGIDSPWVVGERWVLSGSHPKPDVCDEYAHETHYRGGGPGVYRPEDVPPKPHPQCFCFIVAVPLDEDEFIKQYNRGTYDTYISEQMTDFGVRLA
jgi:hypothetical protein